MRDDLPVSGLNFSSLSATDIANTLVWFGSQLQRWGALRTPSQSDYQINFSQVSLMYLVRYGLTTPGAIARTMMITPRAVTTHVDVLVEKGLLERRADVQDRRVVQLRLTDEGMRVSASVEAKALMPLVEYIAHLDRAEQDALSRSVNILRAFFSELRQTTG